MKKSIVLFLILPLLFILESCGPLGPRAFHVAQLNEKGDFQAAAYLSPASGIELQADYAWGDHFYSPADITYSLIKSGQSGFESNAYSLGIGYYTKMKTNGRFDVYYAPRFGAYGNTGSQLKSHFFSNAIGTDLGWRFKHFEAAFSMNVENFSAFNGYWKSDGRSTNLAAAMTMRFGGEKVKFHMQMGLSYPISNYTVDVYPYILNLGINYRLNLKKGTN